MAVPVRLPVEALQHDAVVVEAGLRPGRLREQEGRDLQQGGEAGETQALAHGATSGPGAGASGVPESYRSPAGARASAPASESGFTQDRPLRTGSRPTADRARDQDRSADAV